MLQRSSRGHLYGGTLTYRTSKFKGYGHVAFFSLKLASDPREVMDQDPGFSGIPVQGELQKG